MLLIAVLLAPAAYFICGGAAFYLVYWSHADNDYNGERPRHMDTNRMEADGADGMKKVFSIAGWTGVAAVSLFCLSTLIKTRPSDA